MWKPLGSLMLVRFFLIASAFGPVCGMCAGSTVPVCWKLPSFSRLPAVGVGCAYPGAAKARSNAEAAPKRTALMVCPPRVLVQADAGGIISHPERGVLPQSCEAAMPAAHSRKKRRVKKQFFCKRAKNGNVLPQQTIRTQ